MKEIITRAFYDKNTNTLTYLVFDRESKDAVIIDPVLDFDPLNYRTSNQSVGELATAIQEAKLHPHYVLETHVHADHLSGAQALKKLFPSLQVAISDKIRTVQKTFKDIFGLSEHVSAEGAQFDRLLSNGETLKAGTLSIKVLSTPGHTPVCTTFHIGESLFTGDALFMPDSGTGRCDFPHGSARDLYQSIHEKIYQFSDDTKIYVGHDYQPQGRELRYQTTVGESKKNNIHIRQETKEEEYVEFRTQRDKTLSFPKLFFPSVQVNVDAGHLPRTEKNGKRYLKFPLDFF